MIRKHMSLVIGGVVFVLLGAVLAYFLYVNWAKYAAETTKRDKAFEKYEKLTKRVPFPSPENVDAVRQQMQAFSNYLRGLSAEMSEGQFRAEPLDRSQFAGLYEEMLARMDKEARAAKVAVAKGFAFGFQYYAEGHLPTKDEVGHLFLQLQTVEKLCSILFEEGISTLSTVERPIFEDTVLNAAKDAAEVGEGRVRRRRWGGGEEEQPDKVAPSGFYTDPDGLFTREHYILTFCAPDMVIAKILDRLSTCVPFTVVTKLEVSNLAKPVVVPPKPASKGAGQPGLLQTESAWGSGSATAARGASDGTEEEVLPRELRVTAGTEIPTVRLEVDVYRFPESEAPASEGGGAGEEREEVSA